MIDEHLIRFNKKQKFLFFDTETCNLNLVHDKNLPWEYAWQLCTLDEILTEEEYLVNWELTGRPIEISDDAARFTGYWGKRPKLLVEGIHPEELLEKFEPLLYDPEIIPIAHNGLGFDVYMHNIHRRLCGKKSDYSYVKRFIDTNAIARGVKLDVSLPNSKDTGFEVISHQYKMYGNPVKGVKTSIRALCADFGIEYDEAKAHAALYDVNLLRQIFRHIVFKTEL